MMPIPIQLKNLSFSYGTTVALEQANATIEQDDFVAIVGPNGGGKTTMLKLILGLLQPTSGSISLWNENPIKMRRKIGYLPQATELDPRFPITVSEVVLMGRLNRTRLFGSYTKADKESALHSLEKVGLSQLAQRPMAHLSGGQRQRVLIARALVSEPQLLLLDEPTASLDDYVERELYELLQELNKNMTIAIVSHDIGFVSKYVQKVICVNRQIHTHPTGEIDEKIIHTMYGEHTHMIRHDQEHPHD